MRLRKTTASGDSTPEAAQQKDNILPLGKDNPAVLMHKQESNSLINEVGDDREFIPPGDHLVLIVENDLAFARVMLDAAREKGFKGLMTSMGAAALAMVNDYNPDAILLDIHLPDMQGWLVLERLKNYMATRHIPVAIISTDESQMRAMDSGAFAFVTKPLQSLEVPDKLLVMLTDFMAVQKKCVLIAGPNEIQQAFIAKEITADDLEIITAKDITSARKIMHKRKVDCIISWPELAHLSEDFISNQKDEKSLLTNTMPVIIYDERRDEKMGQKISSRSRSLFHVHSSERLLNLVTSHLHHPMSKLSEK